MGIFKKFAGLDRTRETLEEEPIYADSTEEAADDLEQEEEAPIEDEEADEEAPDEEAESEEEGWLPEEYEEGQLSIDVYQTPENLIVKSTIAGVKPDEIDISINNDMLTIRGKREMTESVREQDYLYRECYWGSFSRSIILPTEIKADKIEAFLENGVLTVVLPKAKSSKQITIKVKGR